MIESGKDNHYFSALNPTGGVLESSAATILLVEDEAIIALTEKRWLQKEGFNVIHVTSGEDAIRKVSQSPESIDLILMDIDLGRDSMDGTQAAREILKDYEIPLLFLSSHQEKEIVDKTEQITSYGYVVKGSSPTVIIASIKMAFKLFQAHKELREKEQLIVQNKSQYSSERKMAEQQFIEDLRRWAALFENAKWGIISTKPESHKVDMVNNEFARMHGYSIEEIKGMPVGGFFAPEARKEVPRHMQVANETGYHSFESVHIRKDGTTFPVMIEVAAIKDNNGKVLFRAAHIKDITEQKKAEEDLSRSGKQLERLIEGSTNLYWELDLTSREIAIVGNSPELLPIGDEIRPGVYSFDQITGHIHPDDIERYYNEIKEILENRKPVYDSEYRKKSRKGEWIWVHTKGSIVERDAEGMPLRISGTQSNITDKKTALEEIKIINEKLRELNATKDKLLSILAHDLRGPFTGFVGLTGELASNIDVLDKKDISEFALILNSTATKIYGLLNNILDWSRVQTGKFEFHPEKLDLGLEIEQTINLFQATSKAKEIGIISNVSGNIPVFADPNMLSTILRNLLSNAIKFTHRQGRITVSAKTVNDSAEISIGDTGTGMDEHILGRIFRIDSVYSTQGTAGEQGTGFGLVLCKEMVEKNGGEIHVVSYPGEGTCFTFTLPLSVN